VAQAASQLATIAGVRKVLVAEQQRAGQGGGVVMEGRDIGTVVFPHADLKIFLDADPVVREQRRLDQNKIHGPSAESMAAELRERDRRDRTRAASPLVAAPDAVIIDSTNLSEDDVLHQIETLVDTKLAIR
jgi:CMP/dCMP kinase